MKWAVAYAREEGWRRGHRGQRLDDFVRNCFHDPKHASSQRHSKRFVLATGGNGRVWIRSHNYKGK